MIKRETLPNGLRIVTETVPYVQSVTIGIWVASGARNEDASNAGISHFIEHMFFKGTETRTARQIADDFDSIGGQLNAFTEKEYTCYYCKVLAEHLPYAFDILADMFLNSSLQEQEIELEKNVVLEEIKRHEDTPDELVHDVFAQTAWQGHPLGNSILGSRKSIEKLTREDMISFTDTRYRPDNIVISAAGNLVHEELVQKITDLFGGLTGTCEACAAQDAPSFSTDCVMTDKSTEQVHFCIGTQGYSQLDPDKYTLAVIDTTLGGGMSSRLFQEIREKRGLVYAIGSYSAAYREGGLFTVYGGTSMENVEEVINLVRVEFANVLNTNISEDELNRAKNQIRAALVLSQESTSSRMIRMAKSELFYRRIVPLEEVISIIVGVTHDDIRRVADKLFGNSKYLITAVGPFKNGKVVISG